MAANDSTRRQFVRICECGCEQPTRIARVSRQNRGWIKGQPMRFIGGHGRPLKTDRTTSRKVYSFGRPFVEFHVARAEAALGHPLPPGAIVHHADGSARDDAPLVICPDAAYHRLLHRRMRVKAAGGNPNTDWICTICYEAKSFSAFWSNRSTHNGLSARCKECSKAYEDDRKARLRT